MKNLKFYVLILATVLTVSFSSCDDDDTNPQGKFEDGVLVVNEGNFQDADGTISHISPDGMVTQDLFGTANNGLALGDVVQSMSIDGEFAYIVVNNSNKMEVVNANTFAAQYTLKNLLLPRYFTTYNGAGYLTEWVSYSEPGRVAIIDLQNHVVTESITTDFGAENIIAHEGKLYVSNNFTNTVSVIDPASKKVIKTIEVGNSPGEILIDSDNMLWVTCGGAYQANDGALVQLDPAKSADEAANSVLKTIELHANVSSKAAINKAKSKIFYYKGSSVYAVNTSDTEGPAAPLFTESAVSSFYGIGIDPEADILYMADSKSFAGNGTVYRYSVDGVAMDDFEVGVGPNSFVFK
jgi:YVTN family beta-propeller protein